MISPEPDHEARGEQVADGIADQAADDRRLPPDRHRAEPIEGPRRSVPVQRDAAVDGDEDDRQGQHSWQQELQVVARRAVSAPPNRLVNISVNRTGIPITSPSCSGRV
jgi:hypothetical protein